MTVPIPALDISPDAPPIEQLAQLARLKRSVVGTRAAKAAVLKAGGVDSLVALLDPRPGSDLEGYLGVSAEAANILATLSIPTLDAVSTLLASGAHRAVALSLPRVLSLVSSSTPAATSQKVVEAHLRALKALFTDLIRVVGPREWGTDVIGASIDAAERRDAENLWAYEPLPVASPTTLASGKGKAKETDADMASAADDAKVDVQQLQEESARVLRVVYEMKTVDDEELPGPSSTAPGSPTAKIRRTPTLDALLDLLIESARDPRPSSRTADLICTFLAGTVRWPSQRAAMMEDDKGAEAVMALRTLVEKGSDKVRESALKALAPIVRDCSGTAVYLMGCNSGVTFQERLYPFTPLVQSPIPSMRLAAATLCTVMSAVRRSVLPSDLGTTFATALLGLIEKEPTLRAQAAFAFAYLVADNLELQKRGVAARCFQIFGEVLKRPALGDHPYPTQALVEEDARVREGILLCIATISALSEPHRRLVLDQRLLPHILFGLSYPSVGVRAAACHCIRALSRSVNVLRTDLVEAHAEDQLVRLLREDENEVVKITAAAAIANLLLDFSPMRSVLIAAGCVQRMCQLVCQFENPALQLNALWALKNVTYQSSATFKRILLHSFDWGYVVAFAGAPANPAISELGLAILRNITCVTNNEVVVPLGVDEARVFLILEERIRLGVVDGGTLGGEAVVKEALYCVNNLATASESAQLAIASRPKLLRDIMSYLDSRVLSLRVAALWVLHNLVYRLRPPSFPSPAERRPYEIIDKLRAMGLDAKLRVLERDPELDVRERVRDLKEALM